MTMTFAGWMFMICAWGIITALAVFCFWKVLRGTPAPGAATEGKETE